MPFPLIPVGQCMFLLAILPAVGMYHCRLSLLTGPSALRRRLTPQRLLTPPVGQTGRPTVPGEPCSPVSTN